MNKRLLDPDVIEFIKEHYKEDASRIILNKSPFADVSSQELAQQIIGLQKAEKKLPTWFKTPQIYFPSKLNLEQTSSEKTAAYKAGLFSGRNSIDLTGGFGIDDYYLSKRFEHLTHCELNADLAEIAQHNYKSLGVENVTVTSKNSISYLEGSTEKYDLIYTDPSRRHDSKGKVFMLKDCEPNIPENLNFLLGIADKILIKTSPLLDITAALSELRKVVTIHCVAVKNEVKELLWIIDKNQNSDSIDYIAVNLDSDFDEPVVIANTKLNHAEAIYGEPHAYLYEPNAALLKLGAFNWISENYKLDKLSANAHLYTSEELIAFPGRRFQIDSVINYSKKEVSKSFKNTQANITTRNFKESVSALRKKFKIKDGGETYLFFTTLANNSTVVIKCRKS
ncbi:THUMP-like domain-containing protein [Leeuwenhoekiella marinoflava]|uniref:Uncharacterized protein n=2 Tax=Leeuwenhoekiella marinoflava TaxID=988 RepID=A0A4V1KSE8_9FLAO|nr:SAM-dependent methyltransferase [Leeuwenhoekiella marinoflava]RXG30739.1 hypothetical protein DSL99_1782 [Leeuwenhoekiella marinoflava]SHF18064.1 hypothetical protein SAMN02745246_01877 [Leeuwenhoekiella marinoflava DSM 3653]